MLSIFGLLLMASRGHADLSNKPTAFDFQERTGFPLTWDDRIIGLDALDADVKGAMVNAGDTLVDWLTARERISASAHANRRAARVVRVFSDQPVYIYQGFALLPDPTTPDAPVDLDKHWNVEIDCNGGDPDKRARCVSLHRDHVQNRGAIALVLAARTIIVRGENATGGMSLVTMSESLHMDGDSTIDLSARQDPAPTFGAGMQYQLFAELIGSPGEAKMIDDSATATSPGAEPGPANPWYFVDPSGSVPNDPLVDLQWQLDVARQIAPDYDWAGVDPCAAAEDRDACWKRREPRGLAGLDGGSWFGLTLRSTPVYARSLGQPGGAGGVGLDHVADIECGAPPVSYDSGCHVHPLGCNPDTGPCNPGAPPSPDDECVCQVPLCNSPPCNVCPDDPGQAANDRLKLLCALDQELQFKLDRIVLRENFYGYPFNYVPPASVQTSHPLAQLDLVKLVKEEMTKTKGDFGFWIEYGAILSGQYNNVTDATTKLNNEIAFLNDATDANGTLTLGLALADQRVHDAALELDQIALTIQQLQGMKVLVKTSKGSGLVDAKELAVGVGLAAAFGFGGPAAGAFAISIFKAGFSNAKEDEAKQQVTAVHATDEAATAAAKDDQKYKQGVFKKTYDAELDDDWAKKGGNAALGALLTGFDPFVQAWLNETGLKSEAKAKQSLGEVPLDAAVLAQAMDAFRAAAKLGQALAERRLEAQKILEAGRRKAQLQASLQTVQTTSPGTTPSTEVQYQIADLALLAAATRVDRAGEYFFLLRRGVERDAVPLDPTTGQSNLAANENSFILSDGICQATTLDASSLDVNLMTLPCFEQRVGFLEAYAAGLQSAISVLDVQDTTVPFADWTLGTDAQGQPVYALTLEVTLAKAHRDFRATHRKQKLHDVVFFLQTNDPVPAAIPIRVRRPQTNLDVYWIGEATPPGGQPGPVFVSFDVAHATPSSPGDLLFQLLRDTSTYQRDAFACNALDVTSPLGGQLDFCKLSNLEAGSLGRAYLEGLSLIGDLDIEVPVASLGGRVPTKLFADVRYTHAINY